MQNSWLTQQTQISKQPAPLKEHVRKEGDESEDDDDDDGLPPLERNMNHIISEDSEEEDEEEDEDDGLPPPERNMNHVKLEDSEEDDDNSE